MLFLSRSSNEPELVGLEALELGLRLPKDTFSAQFAEIISVDLVSGQISQDQTSVQSQLLVGEQIGFGNHRNHIAPFSKLSHTVNVQLTQSLACWSDEVDGRVDSRVGGLWRSLDLALVVEHLLKLRFNIIGQTPGGVSVVDKVAKPRRHDHVQVDSGTPLVDLGRMALDGHVGGGRPVRGDDIFVAQRVDKRALAGTCLAHNKDTELESSFEELFLADLLRGKLDG
ncbi:hypothetical protein OGAPHI_001171 [Ogataea philodendri]|uniref:Uncharacterized protein n=1 Tax=Ogataea philodendri TaxID=1378263 RepID=A0A9P8TA24_9ASCO|nr:uncharacterized protein OGAPHI_001171 [Ogataea philodendri]KAH3670656.1 hypothetical protein OGAPHI_001171 [Ogataea philodendri]